MSKTKCCIREVYSQDKTCEIDAIYYYIGKVRDNVYLHAVCNKHIEYYENITDKKILTKDQYKKFIVVF